VVTPDNALPVVVPEVTAGPNIRHSYVYDEKIIGLAKVREDAQAHVNKGGRSFIHFHRNGNPGACTLEASSFPTNKCYEVEAVTYVAGTSE
jgi:hypothetical protein